MSNTFKLRNGRILLSTEAPGGIYNSSQLKKIAALCDGDSVTVKATEDQRLALIVNPDKAAFVASELKSMGLGVRHYQDGLHQPVSCIGELCEFHEQDALGSALDVSAELEGIKLKSPLKIGINGCAKCCVPCHTLDVSVVGDTNGYRLSLGGKSSQFPEVAGFVAEGIPPTEIARLVRAVVDIYRQNANEGESLQELIDRDGLTSFIQALAPYSQDAATSEDPFDPSLKAEVPMQDDVATIDGPAPIDAETEFAAGSSASEMTMNSAEQGDEALHALTHEESESNPQGLEGSVDADIAPRASSELHVESEIQVPQKAPTLDMDLILDHNADFSMSEVKISGANESHSPAEPTFVEAEVVWDSAESSAEKQAVVVEADLQTMGDPADTVSERESSIDVPHDSATTVEIAEEPHPADEEKIEANLIASIAAQRSLVDSDNLESERAESTDILESATISIASGSEHVSTEKLPFETNPGDNEMSALGNKVSGENTVAIPHFRKEKNKAKLAVQSFDFDDDGNPVIAWSNGILLTLTPEAVIAGQIKFCGHDITIKQTRDGTRIQVDGISMLLPSAA